MGSWRPEVEPDPTIALIVATYGSSEWREAGENTRERLTGLFDQSVACHGPDLATARNAGVLFLTAGWLCFVDADDDLDPGYVNAMRQELAVGRLLAPAAQTVMEGAVGPVEHHYRRDIRHLNPCVIGTLVERALFMEVGGFLDEPIFEDWSLFLRCWRAGATVHPVPAAVYRARIRAGSRNDQPQAIKQAWYWQIRKAYA